MPGDQQDYKAFRQRLDSVLRRRNPEELRTFLVAEGQWQPDAQTDAEAAMWMMIAASPALKDLRGDAERWLLTHGHEAEAGAILGARGSARSGGRPAGQRSHSAHRPAPKGDGAARSPNQPDAANGNAHQKNGPRDTRKPPRRP